MFDTKGVLLYTILLIFIGQNAVAEVKTFSKTDPITDTTFSGISILSDSRDAAIFFACVHKNKLLRIEFRHRKFIHSTYNVVDFLYRVDKEDPQPLILKVEPETRSGYIEAKRYSSPNPYLQRFGEEPKGDKAYYAWAKKIERAMIDDFSKGETAVVRFHDYNDRSYTYRFNLSGIRQSLSALKECLSLS